MLLRTFCGLGTEARASKSPSEPSRNPRGAPQSRAVTPERPHTKHARPVLRRPAVTAPNLASVTATNGLMNTEPSRRFQPNAPA